MNKQDREDYQQDFELSKLVNKLEFTNVNKVKAAYTSTKHKGEYNKRVRQEKLLTQYKHYFELLNHEDNSDLLFHVLSCANFLHAEQYKVISAYLQSGDFKQVASDLGKNYETTKATFRQAVQHLKRLTGETNERNGSSRNDLI